MVRVMAHDCAASDGAYDARVEDQARIAELAATALARLRLR